MLQVCFCEDLKENKTTEQMLAPAGLCRAMGMKVEKAAEKEKGGDGGTEGGEKEAAAGPAGED